MKEINQTTTTKFEIYVNSEQTRETIRRAWDAIISYNMPPKLFVHGGRIAALRRNGDSSVIEILDVDAMRGLLMRIADWFIESESKKRPASVPTIVVRDVLAYPEQHRLPQLDAVVSSPVITDTGEIIHTEGYHASARLWHEPAFGFEFKPVSESPTKDEISEARTILCDELLADFPFLSQSDRAHAVAMLLQPFVRPIIYGPTPLYLIEAPLEGSGKTLLCQTVSIIATGDICETRTLPTREDEVRKMITAELSRGKQVVLLDNVSESSRIDSAKLAEVLTSIRTTDRILGQSKMIPLLNKALWLMTANNPRLSREMRRRRVPVRLDPGVEFPHLRKNFRHKALLDWVRENRAKLVRANLTFVKAWFSAGCPKGEKRLGSFESWSEIMGGILNVAGIPGFMENLFESFAAPDQETLEWREFTTAWFERWNTQPVRVSELNTFCNNQNLLLQVRGNGNIKSQQTRLGTALHSMKDRVFGNLQLRQSLVARSDGRGSRQAYALNQLSNALSYEKTEHSSDINSTASKFDAVENSRKGLGGMGVGAS